ncbi:MAG: hypothetical protein ACYTA3_11235 [Planctomycetota bacterium]
MVHIAGFEREPQVIAHRLLGWFGPVGDQAAVDDVQAPQARRRQRQVADAAAELPRRAAGDDDRPRVVDLAQQRDVGFDAVTQRLDRGREAVGVGVGCRRSVAAAQGVPRRFEGRQLLDRPGGRPR